MTNGAMDNAVNHAVNRAVDWSVYWAVDGAVYWVVESAMLTTDNADDHQAVPTQWDAWGGVA